MIAPTVTRPQAPTSTRRRRLPLLVVYAGLAVTAGYCLAGLGWVAVWFVRYAWAR